MNEPTIMKEFLEIIQKESNRLHLLIDDLLELSAMERENFSLQFGHVELIELMNDALKIVSGSLERKKMAINLNIVEEIVIEGDASRIIQVMVNLLSNAINYSKEQTKITVSVKKIARNVIIEVQDEGIGIEQAELARLFERFYRVDRARSRDSGGTGLGLAIVKHLVDAHSGTVEVESTIGVGTLIRICLPLRQGN